jgi:chromosome segregation ATPase
LKTSARPSAASEGSTPAASDLAALDSARKRLDDAIGRLEKETVARIAQIRAEAKAEATGRVAALETEIAKLKSEKRELERANAELRKAAEHAGGRVEQAIADVRALLAQGEPSGA